MSPRIECEPPIGPVPPRISRKSGYGSGNVMRTVVSSTFESVPCLPLTESSWLGFGVRSLFWYTSSYQNMKSSAVNGSPSDHLWPLRRKKVNVFESAEDSQARARFG